jgi:hypothetical protein
MPKHEAKVLTFSSLQLNPPALLKESLGAVRMTSAASALFLRWPELRFASQNFAAMLMRVWPEPDRRGQSLLDNGLRHALEACARARLEQDDLHERDAFIHAIFAAMERSLALTLCGQTASGTRLYDPLESRLSDWVREFKPSRLEWSREPHACLGVGGARLLFAKRIFRMHEIRVSRLLDGGEGPC